MTRRSRWSRIGTVVSIGCLLLPMPGATVQADDHEPPFVYLMAHGARQRGYRGSTEWARGDSRGGCVGQAADVAGWAFPPPLRVDAGRVSAKVIFKKSDPPTRLVIRSWRKVNDQQDPVGRGRSVRYRLRSLSNRGEITAWLAVIRVVVRHDLYLEASGRWRDRERCGAQSTSWTFHLSARRR